jgi:hypothetical protein
MEKPIRHPNNAEAPKGKLQPFASDRGRRLGATTGSSEFTERTGVFGGERPFAMFGKALRQPALPLAP